MIQVYRAGNENFQKNGDVVLLCRSCTVEAELNGSWHLDLDIPIDHEGRWKLVTDGAVLKVPTWQDDEQLYRISKITKTEDGVSAIAYPIFYDSANDCFLMDVRPTNRSAQEALTIMMDGSPYAGQSDITAHHTAYFVRRNLMSAINGGESPTFVETWGGEIVYDNYTVIINERVGGDYGMEARYGRNINGVSYEVDTSEVITRIVPVAYNGRMMSGNTPWVDSPNIEDFPKVYTKEVHYDNIRLSSDYTGNTDGLIICEDQTELDDALQSAAEDDFDSGVDAPKVTIDIDMAVINSMMAEYPDPLLDENSLPIQDENDDNILSIWYRNFAEFEKVRLGDTIRCRHYKLDITSVARVISLTWDCVRKRVSHVVLGDYKYDYVKSVDQTMHRVARTIREDGTIVAERVRGYLDGAQTQFHTQYNLAERQDVLAILFENLDTTSLMYGALGIGTQGICISKTRTQDGRDWTWTTGVTANGINAEAGVFGLLSDKLGKNYINLDSGDARIGDSTNYLSFDATTGQLSIRATSVTIGVQDVATAISDAATAAANAATAASDAAKTATNYLHYTSSGLVLNNNEATTDTGYSLMLTSSSIKFRYGDVTRSIITDESYRIYRQVTSGGRTINRVAMRITADEVTLYKPNGNTGLTITSDGLTLTDGSVAGMEITSNYLKFEREGTETVLHSMMRLGNASSRAIDVRRAEDLNSQNVLADYFYVDFNGKLYAKNAEITGSITASSGKIGGYTIDGEEFYCGNICLYPLITGADGNIYSGIQLGVAHNVRNVKYYILENGDACFKDTTVEQLDCSKIVNANYGISVRSYGPTSSQDFAVSGSNIYLYHLSGAVSLGVTNTGTLYSSSSSIRFKELSDAPVDVSKFYGLEAKTARFKPGVLPDGHEWEGLYMPMLIAEEVDAICHEAAAHDEDGRVMDWNYRVMIPVHQQMLVEQYQKIRELEARLDWIQQKGV